MKREVLISVVGLALAVGAGERIGLLDECRYDAAKLPEGGAARALLAANPDAGTAVASNAVSLLGPLNVGLEKRVTVGDGRVAYAAGAETRIGQAEGHSHSVAP